MPIPNENNQRSSVQPEKERNVLDATHLFGETRLAKRKPTEFLVVDRRELEKIKKSLDKVKPASQFSQNAFWASFSLFIGSGFFLAAISPGEQREWVKILGWTTTIVFAVFSITFLIFSLREKSDFVASVEDIKLEIVSFEEEYIFDENPK